MDNRTSTEKADASKPPVRFPRGFPEVCVILALKVAFIFGLWYFFFDPDKRIDQTAENVAASLLDRTPPRPTKETTP